MLVPFGNIGVNGTHLNFEIEFRTFEIGRVEGDIGCEFVEMAANFLKYMINAEIDI